MKEPFTYTIIAAFAILCSCFCITVNQYAIRETYSEKTENMGVSPFLESGTIIHQEINVNGEITELELMTEGISEGDNGSIKVLLKHPKGSWSEYFLFDEIFKKGQRISIKLPSGIVGPLDVYISGSNHVKPIVLKTRSEKLLGQYDINGAIQNGNLLVTVKTAVIPRYTYLRICLLVFMLLVFGFHIFMYRFSENKREKGLYWLAVVYIFCTISIRYPISTLLAEPYWETLTNFSHQTLVRGIRGSFFLDDVGYWPLLPRLISYVIIFLFYQKKYIGIFYGIICLSIIVGLTAEFVKATYSRYLFLEARFIISLFIGVTRYLDISQMLLLHNIAYMGIFVIIFVFLNDLDVMPSYMRGGGVFFITFLFTCSKPQYIGLIPLMLLLIATKWNQIGTRKLQYCLICCIGPFLQILYLLSGLAEDSHPGKRVGGLFHNVFETYYTYI